MAFPPAFLDELKSRLVLSDIVGRRVKLRKGPRGEFAGLCPFHNEKTPSFTVSDDKAFYHCFGCGAHGSVFDFVMNTENLQFPEAVEQLAGVAGMEVPQLSPAAAEAARRSATLHEVMDKAATWYADQLKSNGGSGARAYLEKRGVSPSAVTGFRLGFAPNGRTMLKDALLAREVSEAQLIETGLVVKPEDGGATFDRFRNRLMFPILIRVVGSSPSAVARWAMRAPNTSIRPKPACFTKAARFTVCSMRANRSARPAPPSSPRGIWTSSRWPMAALPMRSHRWGPR